MDLIDQIDRERIPKHIAIIMDGNGRWAKSQGKARIFGHKNALTAVRETAETAAKLGVEYVTFYAFSMENWNRPQYEVNALMELLMFAINNEVKTLNKYDIRLLAVGDLKSLPKRCYRELRSAMEKTETNKRMNLILALSYSSRWEIINAARNIARDVKGNLLSEDSINEEVFHSYLTTSGIPDPELMIRTSGEYRISNFLLWQLAYAELAFLDKFWPDFRKEDLIKVIHDYQNRERRFGKISEQLNSK